MTLFWILTGAMALVVAALLVLALLRGRRAIGPAEAFDMQVYRDQLKEIDRDVARGTLPEAEAERLRAEVSRRLLAADTRAQSATEAGGQPRRATQVLAVAIAVLTVGGAFGLYAQLGAPGYPDLSLKSRIADAAKTFETRPSQAEVEAQLPAQTNPDAPQDYAALVVKLRQAVADRPDDMRGQQLLARSEAALGNFKQSYEALDRIIALKGDKATAQDYADLADMMILAAGGYVSPEAQKVLETALSRDPKNGVARYYGGMMMAQTGRPDIAFRMWDALLREGPADAAWIPPIYEQIEDMAYRAGISDYTPPGKTAPRGPSGADIAAAQDMSPADRMNMIRGMVGQLSDRLATEGGPPEDWARLISSLMVLDEADQAREIWQNAQQVFADTPQALDTVRQAAQRAGLTE